MITKTDELKDRISARRHQLMARLSELKADTRKEAASARAALEQGLAELEQTIKGGWDHLSEAARTKLNAWLDRT